MRDFVARHGEAATFIEKLTIRDGETVYRAGEPSSAVYCVYSGLVKLIAAKAGDADERAGRIVRIVQPVGVVGMEALFLSSFQCTAVAVNDVMACRISIANLKDMLDAVPRIRMRLLHYCYGELARVQEWLADFVDHSATARVRIARLLLHMREGKTDRLHCLRHHEMASILGVAMETICRNLGRMTHDGLISEYKSASVSGYYDADIPGLERVAHGG
jgi:CRP/FNR family transcriptional regulator